MSVNNAHQTLMKKFALALFACCCLFTTAGFAQNKDQTTVAQAVEQLRLLMIDPDKGKLDALVTPELTYGHSSGKIENKAEFMEALVSGASDFTAIDLTGQTVTIVDNTAWVRHTLMGQTMNDGKPGQTKLGVLLVWLRQKGAWKLLARQAVKI